MRVKSFNRGRTDLTNIDTLNSEELAQVAMDFVDRRDAFAAKPEHRLAVAQVFATLSVRAALRERG